jgi:hypothetical protein
MKSHVATRPRVARAHPPENVDVRAILRLTLNVVTQNLTVTLCTTLSETLAGQIARESV